MSDDVTNDDLRAEVEAMDGVEMVAAAVPNANADTERQYAA